MNQTTRKQVDNVREKFFDKWPSAKDLATANLADIVECIRSLGFYNRRAKTLQKFSEKWQETWSSPLELPGIGQYALDSWNIFVEGVLVEDPSDHVLKDYMKWRQEIDKTKLP